MCYFKPWSVKSNVGRFQWQRHKKESKKYIYRRIRGARGEFPDTGRTEIAHGSIGPEEMLLLFLNVCTNRKEWKQSLHFLLAQCPNLHKWCVQVSVKDERRRPEKPEEHKHKSFLAHVSAVITGSSSFCFSLLRSVYWWWR